MAATTQNPWTHDVFLSFRGEDTRKSFTQKLYSALVESDIRTFMDDDKLPRGREISVQLIKAIEESRISVVVLSENYGDSRWCLNELVKIVECKKTRGQLVLPVFYDVDPSDVGRQTGKFGDGFVGLIQRYTSRMNIVKDWRYALNEVADLPGWRLLKESTNGGEMNFIKKIVERLQCEVKQTYLNVVKYPVGLDSRVHDIQKLLSIGSEDVRMVGIYGVGGIGKTTMAKAVYSMIFQHFECSSFLHDVKGVSNKTNGLVHLQELLVSQLLKDEDLKVGKFHNCLLERKFHPKRVLVVLDDVDNLRQVNLLVKRHNWFGSGSRIIITTRDEQLLERVNANEIYHAQELNYDESFKLFNWHAFKNGMPLQEYVEISHNLVTSVGGSPLVLEVLGSSLFGRNMIKWKRALEKVRQVPSGQIKEILRLSFDTLDDDKIKDIFLDVVCFFIGMDKDNVISILDGCDYFAEIGISDLTSRCLLTVNCKNELKMHDLIRELGMEIICKHELGNRSRLWLHEDIQDVLKNGKGREVIEGILLDLPISKQLNFETKLFERMQKLRLLKISNVHLDGSFAGVFEELRWLCWHYCPLKYLPSHFHPEKLVALDMQNNKINILWQGIKFFTSLKILNLSHSECLTSTPNFIGVPNLEVLLLEGCTNLLELHPSIGHLDRLIHLNMNYCKNLRKLPSGICKLNLLEKLFLDGCSSLQLFPQQLGNMKCLMELHASETAIKLLPNSIGFLKNLTYIWQSNVNLSARSFISLFLSVILWRSANIKDFHFPSPSISGLCSLKWLDLSYCKLSDGDIPLELSGLSSLEKLDLAGNMFISLPSIFCHLSNLEYLTMNSCKSLQSIPEFPSNLVRLDIRDCISLYELPNLSNLQHLQELDLRNCSSLAEIQGLKNLNFLQTIRMDGCGNLTSTFINNLFQGHSQRVVNCDIFLTRTRIPDWFNHQQKGRSSICFDMPLDVENGLVGITLCVLYSCKEWNYSSLSPRVSIRRNAVEWAHSATFKGMMAGEKILWVSHLALRCIGYPLQGGERFEVLITEDKSVEVQESGVRLVYKHHIEENVVHGNDYGGQSAFKEKG